MERQMKDIWKDIWKDRWTDRWTDRWEDREPSIERYFDGDSGKGDLGIRKKVSKCVKNEREK